MNKRRKISLIALVAIAIIAISFSSTQFSIFPYQAPITVSVIDNKGNLVPNAEIFWYAGDEDPSYQYMLSNPQMYPNPIPMPNQWLYYGSTNIYGYFKFVGYADQQMKATFNGAVGYATTTDSDTCVISLPILVGQTAQPTPTPTPKPTASPAPKFTVTFQSRNVPEGLKWGASIDNGNAIYSTTNRISTVVTEGMHRITIVTNPLGYKSDWQQNAEFTVYGNDALYYISFSQLTSEDIANEPKVTMTVDNPAPKSNEKIWFTISTANPKVTTGNGELSAYVNNVLVQTQSFQMASNGLALTSWGDLYTTAIAHNTNTIVFRSEVNGLPSNDVTVTISNLNNDGSQASPSPVPSSTAQPPNPPSWWYKLLTDIWNFFFGWI